MSHQLEALTTATLSMAMNAAVLRQQAIAANIANASTDGYTPMKLAFERYLADARQAVREKGSVDSFSLAGVRMELEPALDAQGQPARVQLDSEMAELARNAVQYQALAQGLSRHLSILATAVADGRR